MFLVSFHELQSLDRFSERARGARGQRQNALTTESLGADGVIGGLADAKRQQNFSFPKVDLKSETQFLVVLNLEEFRFSKFGD